MGGTPHVPVYLLFIVLFVLHLLHSIYWPTAFSCYNTEYSLIGKVLRLQFELCVSKIILCPDRGVNFYER